MFSDNNESDKGGSCAIRYACPSFSHLGEWIVKNEWHTMGCYITNVWGEALPPLYILDSRAQYEDNFKIDPRVCIGLHDVVIEYGLGDDYFRELCRK